MKATAEDLINSLLDDKKLNLFRGDSNEFSFGRIPFNLPVLDNLDDTLKPVLGSIPSPLERPSGCVFHTRCKIYEEGLCNNEEPQLKSFSSNHKVACLKVDSNE